MIPSTILPMGLRVNRDGLHMVRRGNTVWILDSWAPECLENRGVQSYARGLRQLNCDLAREYKAKVIGSLLVKAGDGFRFSITCLRRENSLNANHSRRRRL